MRVGRIAVAAMMSTWCAMVAVMPSRVQAQAADNVAQTPPPPAPGASPALDSARAERGGRLRITLYTYGPGDVVFERFGHISLAVTDTVSGEDIAFNWGMFDFDQPNFITRFLTGDTKYWMEGYPAADFNALYRQQNRSIRAQVLALTPMQRGAIQDFVSWNAQEANKYYRYDYYNDNCATRIRDLLDWATGGQLKPQWSGVSAAADTARTWRGETARITADDTPIYVLTQIALGRRADAVLTRWQEAFLPEHLATHLAASKLVTSDRMEFTANRTAMSPVPPQRQWIGLIVGLVSAALMLAVGLLARTNTAARGLLGALCATWYGVGGMLGTALLLAGTVTRHEPYMGSNATLALLNPLLLVAAVFVTRALVGSRTSHAARTTGFRVASLITIVALTATIGVLLLQGDPRQQHAMLVLAIIPVHAAFTLLTWQRQRQS